MKKTTKFFIITFFLILGLFLRLHYIRITPYSVDTDSSIVGLMGKHILEGDFPVFYYGQPYMGSLEAFVAAFFFFFFGISKLTLSLSPLFFSLLFIISTYFLGKEFGNAEVGLIAIILACVPAVYLVTFSGVARGGYIETLFFGNLILILTRKICRGGLSVKKEYLLFSWLGFIAGLAWWTNFLVIYYLAVAAIFIFLYDKKIIFSPRILAAGLAFFVGSLPFWIYNFTNSFLSFSGTATFQNALRKEALNKLFLRDIPILLNLESYKYEFTLSHRIFAGLMALIYLTSIIYLIFSSRKGLANLFKLSVRRENGIEMLVLFMFSVVFFFSFTHFGLFGTQRYLLPVFSLMPFTVAYLSVRIKRFSKVLFTAMISFMVIYNIFGVYKAYGVDLKYSLADDKKFINLLEFLNQNNLKRVIVPDCLSSKISFLSKEEIIGSEPRLERCRRHELAVDASSEPAIVTYPMSHFKEALRSLCGEFKFHDAGKYHIFYSFKQPLHSGKLIPPDKWKAESNFCSEWTASAFDRNIKNFWTSGKEKTPGMYFELDLGRAYKINKIQLLNGNHFHNYPNGYVLEVSPDGKKWARIIDLPSCEVLYWSGPRVFWRGDESRLEVGFEPVEARFIKITQTGEHPVYPWEINEIYVYEYLGNKKNTDYDVSGLIKFLKQKGVEFVYADRWLSAKIMEDTKDKIQALKPYNDKYPNDTVTSRIVDFLKNMALVVEKEDTEVLEKTLQRLNINSHKESLGNFTVYYSIRPENKIGLYRKALYWTGLGLIEADIKKGKKKADICFRSGLKYMQKNRWDEAAAKFEEAVNSYSNHLGALSNLIECYHRVGKTEEKEEVEKIIQEEFTPQYKKKAVINNKIEFLGYSIDREEVKPGDKFTIDYFWQCLDGMKKDYHIFVHFIRGNEIFQNDHRPLDGENPTSQWIRGEVIRESYEVKVPEDVKPGIFNICMGFWDAEGNKQRLKIKKTNLPLPDGKIQVGSLKVF